MARWKGTGLAAAAMGSFVPVALPWVGRSLASLVVLYISVAYAMAADKDYAGCIGKNVDPDKRCAARFRKGPQPRPQEPIWLFRPGRDPDQKADYDGAIADLSQAIKLDPKFAAAYDARSWAWEARTITSAPRPTARRRSLGAN